MLLRLLRLPQALRRKQSLSLRPSSPSQSLTPNDPPSRLNSNTPTGTPYFNGRHNYVGPNPRSVHAARDGLVFDWRDLPGEGEAPGEWTYCQCTAEPVEASDAIR